MLPQIAPVIANALAQAKLVNISSDGKGAAGGAADQITSVIQTIMAAQFVTNTLKPEAPAAPAVSPGRPGGPEGRQTRITRTRSV